MADKVVQYSDTYIEKCFAAWYAAGCPSINRFHEIMPTDEYGRKPAMATLSPWFIERGWWERRDVLDAKAAVKIDDELVALKVNMLREQASQSRAVRQKAFDHILENGFDSSASAISAFIKASENERITLGISKTIQKLSEMDDEEVMATVKELAERAGTVIDAADIPDGESAEP